MSFRELHQRLLRPDRPGSIRSGPDALFHARLETRRAGEAYDWDGIRRCAPGQPPFVLFQATLEGAGYYQDADGRTRLDPGKAFLTAVPSPHRYGLPSGPDAHWTFVFVLVRHAYLVERLAERQRTVGARLDIEPDSPLLSRAAALCAGGFPDRWAEELALFGFLMEYERHTDPARRADADSLEDRVRDFARQRLDRPLDVAELARCHGLSRSRFSRRFKEATGATPARFLLSVRLDEAARRLSDTEDTLGAVAAACGFADANHLCKAFRRRFLMTPGAFRRQVR